MVQTSPSRTQLQAEIEILQQKLRSQQGDLQETLDLYQAGASTVRQLVTALAKSTSLDQAISIILVNLRALVPYDLAGLFLLSKGNQIFERNFTGADPRIRSFPDDHPLVAELESSPGHLIYANIQSDTRFQDWAGMQPIRSWMGVPIHVGKEMVAFLSLGSLKEAFYRESDAQKAGEFISPLEELFVINSAPDLFQRPGGSLDIISHLSLALGQAESREDTFRTILTQISRLFDQAHGVFLFPTPRSDRLDVVFAFDQRLHGLQHTRLINHQMDQNGDNPDLLWHTFDTGEIGIIQDFETMSVEDPTHFYAALLQGSSCVIFVPLTWEEKSFAVLAIIFSQPIEFTNELKHMVESIAQLTSVTFQRLFNLEALEKELSEERNRLIEQTEQSAVIEERQRLARELHDSVTQLIYSQVLFAGAGLKVLRSGDLSLSEEYLQRIHMVAQQALKEMRLLVFELRPQDGLEDGLIPALQRRLDTVERRSNLQVNFSWSGSPELEKSTEIALYYISMEALNNVLKHSQATELNISLEIKGSSLLYELSDNGVGFDPQTVENGGGLGLVSMKERAVTAGGKLDVFTQPGLGTRLLVTIEQD